MKHISSILIVAFSALAAQSVQAAPPVWTEFRSGRTSVVRRLPRVDSSSAPLSQARTEPRPPERRLPRVDSSFEPLPAPSFDPSLSPQGTPTLEGTRANVERDAQGWMTPYLQRVANMPDVAGLLEVEGSPGLPQGFLPWWDPIIRKPTGMAKTALPITVDGLVQSALVHSPHVQAILTEPHIRRTVLVEEDAEFDWRTYLETTYDDVNEPVGNTLTTGTNASRFKDQNWSGSGGFRRRTSTGGELELSQRLGYQRSNSVFLVPQPQGTTRLELSYTQPLLSGSGKAYNESRIVLARIDTNSAEDKVAEELQDHLLKVTQAYWELYRARAEFFQRRKVLQESVTILRHLVGREHVDSLERQILRAKAAVTSRRSEIARASTSIRNAESRLRFLVNDPALLNSGALEFIPRDAPAADALGVSMRDGLSMALLNRPDISKAIRSMLSTTVRLGVAKNEILPKLDLLVSTYVAGLEGDARIFSAFGNQFADGRPSFTVGLLFEVPVGNRAAHARFARRQWEMRRAASQFRSIVEQSLTETEVAIREVHTTHREMVGKYEAMVAAANETRYLVARWQTLPGLDDSATLLLENLLDSQERLADEESAFVQAQVQYSISLVRLRKAMGTLLKFGPPL